MTTTVKDTQRVIDEYSKYVLNTYTRTPLVVTKAKGSRVWDVEGKEYLDLFPGWGVSALGYNHPWVMNALRGQAGRVAHVPNNFYQPGQWRAAKAIIERSFPGKVFFGNSGAEAVEAGIKFARYIAPGRPEIIVTEQSFHGRTMGALSATGQDKPQQGFEPLVPDFKRVPLNDIEAVKKAITPKTCALLVEPIQGEGGVNVATKKWLEAVRALCDQHNMALIFDEIQTGFGRTGTWFGYQQSGVVPDMMLLAKALGGGFPVGAIVVSDAIATKIGPGTHGSTYGGNPLACASIVAVVEAIEKEKLLDRVKLLSDYVFRRLAKIQAKCPIITEVRGCGLMIGIQLNCSGQEIVNNVRAQGLLLNCTQGSVLRLLPAMTITKKQLSHGLTVLEKALMHYADGMQGEK